VACRLEGIDDLEAWKAFSEPVGCLLEALWEALGGSWQPLASLLGASLKSLGASWGPLGASGDVLVAP